jgi:hypothetical protein
MTEIAVRRVKGLSNLEFLEKYGKPGCVGLMGGSSAIDRAIRVGQKALDPALKRSHWSHALIFEGERVDGKRWVIESDIDGIHNGVQENRISKYEDEKAWPNLAVLDFGLDAKQVAKVIEAGLELLALRTRYAIGGLLETYWAMMRKTLKTGRKKDSTFCSAFVRAVYHRAELDLMPAVAIQHTMPEHLWRVELPHTRTLLLRDE